VTRRRALLLAAVWTVPSLFFLLLVSIVYGAFRIEVPSAADEAMRVDAMAVMRAALDGSAPPPASTRLGRALSDEGPIVAVVYLDGQEVARSIGYGDTWGDALTAAATELGKAKFVAERDAATRKRARIRIDAVVGRGPLPGEHALFDTMAMAGIGRLLALNPGLEGIGGVVEDKEIVLVPHDLIAAPDKVLQKKRPLKVAADFTIGVDLPTADKMLVARAGAPAGTKPHSHFRLRVDSFAERAEADRAKAPVALYRDWPKRPPLTADALREAALEGGRYLVAHLGPNGRYVYNHNLNTGVATDPMRPGEYSIPRHAGTTYFLAELYRFTKEPFLREPIERAFAHMDFLVGQSKCHGELPNGEPYSCVIDRGEQVAAMGSTALAVVALAEYHRATGDPRYLELTTRLANWILFMQRPDGTFRHRFDVRTKTPNEKIKDLYYSGEAALALARMHVITGDRKYADAAGKGLDQLVHAYDFFLGGFFYGEEHWTCIASEAVWPAVKNDQYRVFCNGYGAFLRNQQAAVGDHPDEDDLAGAYNMTPFVMPWNTPAGSRTEAMLSAYLLGVHHGKPEQEIKDQILAAMSYTLGQMITPESDIASMGPLRVLGAVPGSPIDRVVRIDYVQHVCSAQIRTWAVLEGKGRGDEAPPMTTPPPAPPTPDAAPALDAAPLPDAGPKNPAVMQ
jgi:hypothetical protein